MTPESCNSLNQYRIGTWNANGLQNHRDEVEILINNNEIDILLISETHFQENSFLKISGYVCYDTRHPSGAARGGTAVLIRKDIQHYEIDKFATTEIQATSVVIKDKNGPLVISSVYCPPNQKLTLETINQFFKLLGPRWMAGEDWNAKHLTWGSRLNTTRGKALQSH